MQKSQAINNTSAAKRQDLNFVANIFAQKIRVLVLSGCFIGVISALSGQNLYAMTSEEYQTKAQKLYRIAQFTHWPPKKVVNLCIYEPNPFENTLLSIVQNKYIDGKKLRLHNIAGLQKISVCDLLFINKDINPNQIKNLLSAVGLGVLTVGETSAFLQLGGMINFINAKGQFAINHAAVKRAGVKLSSQLSKLAK